LGLFYNEVLGYCNLNTYEDEEDVAFIGQRIGEPLKWRHIRRNIEGHNIRKIKYTALLQNLPKLG
jgi:hypothetical protein